MAATSELYRGMIIKHNNEPCILIEKEFYSPGKGSAFNRCKLKSIKTGKIVNVVFKSGEKVDELEVSTRNMQYLYADDNYAYFMNPDTFDQVTVPLEDIPGKTDYLHSDAKYIMSFYEDEVIYVQLPAKISLVITEAPEAVKGDTATNALKEVTVETGLKVKVPLFIKTGDKIIINTESGEYYSKENK
ncbi:Elongation factor P [Patescibacteria group bacterium]|jgi:elongation factor P|nr:elongation factor P [Candidatus Dojkabacteria bacterium]CAG1021114.1 Elongation factor P [Patescibacteria group bacterium]